MEYKPYSISDELLENWFSNNKKLLKGLSVHALVCLYFLCLYAYASSFEKTYFDSTNLLIATLGPIFSVVIVSILNNLEQ